jgi:alpha-glucosidase
VSSGISGFALNHSDIGGYTTITHPIQDVHRSKALFLRWAELAAFTPVFRTHEGSRPAENHQWDSDAGTLAHFDRMATVFACLQPYRKRLMTEAAERGWPLVRHPWLHDPESPAFQRARLDVFMLGSDVFVAPVMRRRQARVRTTLPDGMWTHLWTGEVARGGRRVRVAAPFGEPAVWVRAGSEVATELRACVVGLPDLDVRD